MDHVFFVESIVTYHWIYRKKWRITVSSYNSYLKHDFIIPYIEEGSFIPLVLIDTGIVKYHENIWFYIQYNLRTLHIRKSIFWWNYDYVAALCDTPSLEDKPLCETPDDIILYLVTYNKPVVKYSEFSKQRCEKKKPNKQTKRQRIMGVNGCRAVIYSRMIPPLWIEGIMTTGLYMILNIFYEKFGFDQSISRL